MSKCYDNPDYDDASSDIQNTWNQHPKVEQKHETKVMKNIHVLQTDKPSRLACDFDKLILNSRLLSPILYKTQNIYITSDEEIKKGDWCLNVSKNLLFKKDKVPMDIMWKKIILTTDQDLIKDGVQSIDDEFLKWFVKNPSCEEIEVESNYRVKSGTIKEHNEGKAGYEYYDYKIIIPKEIQPQQIWNAEKKEGIKKLIQKQKLIDMMEQDEQLGLYQETLEEAAERLTYTDMLSWENTLSKASFIAGAKWQQERSYSEEEVIELLASYAEWTINGDCLYYEWFEQFKKK